MHARTPLDGPNTLNNPAIAPNGLHSQRYAIVRVATHDCKVLCSPHSSVCSYHAHELRKEQAALAGQRYSPCHMSLFRMVVLLATATSGPVLIALL